MHARLRRQAVYRRLDGTVIVGDAALAKAIMTASGSSIGTRPAFWRTNNQILDNDTQRELNKALGTRLREIDPCTLGAATAKDSRHFVGDLGIATVTAVAHQLDAVLTGGNVALQHIVNRFLTELFLPTIKLTISTRANQRLFKTLSFQAASELSKVDDQPYGLTAKATAVMSDLERGELYLRRCAAVVSSLAVSLSWILWGLNWYNTPAHGRARERDSDGSWFAMECLRFWPVTWSHRRIALEDAELIDERLRPGDHIIISTFTLNRDSNIWERPDSFEPIRWSTGASRAGALWNFGIGPGSCIARHFSIPFLKSFSRHALAEPEKYSLQYRHRSKPVASTSFSPPASVFFKYQ